MKCFQLVQIVLSVKMRATRQNEHEQYGTSHLVSIHASSLYVTLLFKAVVVGNSRQPAANAP